MPEQFYDAATYQARDSVGYLVRRLYSIMRTRLEAAFAHHGLTLMQWIVLMHVRDGLARTASDIAREFSHDTGALTRVIDQLEKRGLLRRRRSARDRRVVELELTRAADVRQCVCELGHAGKQLVAQHLLQRLVIVWEWMQSELRQARSMREVFLSHHGRVPLLEQFVPLALEL